MPFSASISLKTEGEAPKKKTACARDPSLDEDAGLDRAITRWAYCGIVALEKLG